ncbi:GntR family transcriptional regulator [Streptomyces xiamenensis]
MQTSPRGTYLQVAESIRAQINNDPELTQLPPVSQLMQRYSASRTLVNRALNVLKREGVVTSAQGAGWHVIRAGDASRPLVSSLRAVFAEDGLTVGSAFPSESALCIRFGRSRPAVRSALLELERDGLLERVPGKPRVVRALPDSTDDS